MQAPHYRKIELQSPADLTYLYTNAVAQARQKLDLHLPPSANDNDPLKERVKELVDEVRRPRPNSAAPLLSFGGSLSKKHSPTRPSPSVSTVSISTPEKQGQKTLATNHFPSRLRLLPKRLSSTSHMIRNSRRALPRSMRNWSP